MRQEWFNTKYVYNNFFLLVKIWQKWRNSLWTVVRLVMDSFTIIDIRVLWRNGQLRKALMFIFVVFTIRGKLEEIC
jgi:nitric oxide synthase oxygenase domain/subunit